MAKEGRKRRLSLVFTPSPTRFGCGIPGRLPLKESGSSAPALHIGVAGARGRRVAASSQEIVPGAVYRAPTETALRAAPTRAGGEWPVRRQEFLPGTVYRAPTETAPRAAPAHEGDEWPACRQEFMPGVAVLRPTNLRAAERVRANGG